MQIQDVPFSVIDWSRVKPTEHPGETGAATWRTFECGNLRVRMVEYSSEYGQTTGAAAAMLSW